MTLSAAKALRPPTPATMAKAPRPANVWRRLMRARACLLVLLVMSFVSLFAVAFLEPRGIGEAGFHLWHFMRRPHTTALVSDRLSPNSIGNELRISVS